MLNQRLEETGESAPAAPQQSVSRLGQWPCQIKLVAPNAPYFNGAKLLIAADCTAYAYARMHEDFMKGKVTLIGCPKLDDIDYSEKRQRLFPIMIFRALRLYVWKFRAVVVWSLQQRRHYRQAVNLFHGR